MNNGNIEEHATLYKVTQFQQNYLLRKGVSFRPDENESHNLNSNHLAYLESPANS